MTNRAAGTHVVTPRPLSRADAAHCAITCTDIERVRQGMIIALRRSKTDQEGAGRKIGIPFGRTRHCPVIAVDHWLSVSGIDHCPVFRPVDRHGRVSPERLSGEAVSLVVKERVAAAGIDAFGFSGHSLRAGFATSAAQAGVSALKIGARAMPWTELVFYLARTIFRRAMAPGST